MTLTLTRRTQMMMTTTMMTMMMTTMMTMTSGRSPMPRTTDPSGRRTRWWPGIRGRIVVGYVALLAAALAISIVVTRQVLAGRLDRDIDRALTQEIEELRSLAGGTDPETGEPFGTDSAAILDTFLRRSVPGSNEAFYTLVDGTQFLSSFDAPQSVWQDRRLVDRWASVEQPERATVSTADGEMRFLAVPLQTVEGPDAVFVVAHFLDTDRDEILVVVRVLMVAAGVVLAASAVLAWSLAGRVLRPVRELTSTARSISETDLTRRIPVSGRDELAELGATFNEMVERLEQGFAQQRQFLDDVAHELRTPITISRGHLELLGDDPDERRETVAIITDELDRMNRYVDDLLLLAKVEQHDFLRLEPIDLGELAATLDGRVRSLGQRAWTIEAAPAPGTIAIVGDRGRLVQAMLNLATNAVQHTEQGDEIALGVAGAPPGQPPADHVDGNVQMWVRDTGPGLDPATIGQLFERRYRGAASRRQRSDGMGIGLSIVDAIARGHGGHAQAANEPDGGARFTITIPIEPDEEHDR
jgi:two-component system OmpR family sensor kinase